MQENIFDKLNNWIRNSVMVKTFSIAILILLMLIPTEMVDSLILERMTRQDEAVEEISSKWGYDQNITGPILTIPYHSYQRNEKNEIVNVKNYAHFLPKTLQINGELIPEIRYRGIYEVVVYKGIFEISGSFNFPDFTAWKISNSSILWDEATVSVGIPDMRGINDRIDLNWNNNQLEFNPGTSTNDVVQSGISVPVTLLDSIKIKQDFKFSVNLNGSKSMNFMPIGSTTVVNLKSKWSTPSFTGQFLPDERIVNNDGFSCTWDVLQLNRNFPQQWLGASYNPSDSQFGVELKVGVNQYQKNERTAKYAVLIISLTFIMFFFMEIINTRRIHPIQYLLVGFALTIFYALLLALSEQLHFNFSYLIASVAVISLIVIYVHGMLRSIRMTSIIGGLLIVVYSFVFVILQLEDYALLVGSIGLFIVLAVIMYYTRKLDWYNLKSEK